MKNKKKINMVVLVISILLLVIYIKFNLVTKEKKDALNSTVAEFQDGSKEIKISESYTDKNLDNVYIDSKYNKSDNNLNLIDWSKDEIIKSIKLNENEVVFRTFKLNDGYAIIICNNKAKRIHPKAIKFYDSQLNFKKEIDLKKVFSSVMECSHWIADISLDGKKIAWGSLKSIYVYDTESNELTTIYEDDNPESIIFYNIKFDKSGKDIIYYGCNLVDGENSTSYGIIDMDTNAIINYHEKDYNDPCMIYISDKYACITDFIDGFTDTSSGKILLLDLFTKKQKVMEVDGTESTCAIVSNNGEYLVAVNNEMDEQMCIRRYEVSTNKILNEKYIASSNRFNIEKIIEGEAEKFYLLGTKNNKSIVHEFDCGGAEDETNL